MKPSFDLTDRVILVTGGGGYLGGAVCDALAAHGAHVLVADIKQDMAQTTVDRIAGSGSTGSAEALALDVGDESSINEVYAGISKLDGLVNLAAACRGKTMDEMSLDDWEAGLKVTLTGAFLMSRGAEDGRARRERRAFFQHVRHGQPRPADVRRVVQPQFAGLRRGQRWRVAVDALTGRRLGEAEHPGQRRGPGAVSQNVRPRRERRVRRAIERARAVGPGRPSRRDRRVGGVTSSSPFKLNRRRLPFV